MKSGWQARLIGDLCEVIAGQSPEGRFYNSDGNGIPFYQGKKDFGEKFIEEPTTWTLQTTKFARQGDILMSVRAPVGPINFATNDICIGRGLAAIRSGTELNRDFLYYQLLSLQPKIAGNAGAVFASISKSNIEQIGIAIAPPAEQKRIVGILDEAFDGIDAAKANAERNLQNTRALFESSLQAAFSKRGEGWAERSLGTLANFRNGINYTKNSKGDRIKIVGVKDFQKSFWVPSENLDTVTVDGSLNDLDVLKRGDILTVRSNGNLQLIGRCLVATEVRDKMSHSGFTIRIRLSNGEVSPEYLGHFMKCASSKKWLIDGGTGTNIKSLNQQTLSGLKVPYPPNSEQKALVARLESISKKTERLETVYKQKLAALDALKKSLLHQAFTGAL